MTSNPERSAAERPILVFGGAHIDRRGRIEGDAVRGASNPGHWFEEAGGGAFNAARALARLGHKVQLVTPRGGDAAGEAVADAAAAAGIDDRPFTFLDRATPSYTAILDNRGELLIALADMDLYRYFSPRRLKIRAVRDALDGAGLVLCDANLPEETLLAIAQACVERRLPLAGIAISPAKVVRFRPALQHLDWLFMNGAEAQALTGVTTQRAEEWPALLRQAGLSGGVVTGGTAAAVAFDGDICACLLPPAIDAVTDVTGAGDALAAGFLSAIIHGAGPAVALRNGTALAGITVRSAQATPDDLTAELLKSRLHLVPEAQILS